MSLLVLFIIWLKLYIHFIHQLLSKIAQSLFSFIIFVYFSERLILMVCTSFLISHKNQRPRKFNAYLSRAPITNEIVVFNVIVLVFGKSGLVNGCHEPLPLTTVLV